MASQPSDCNSCVSWKWVIPTFKLPDRAPSCHSILALELVKEYQSRLSIHFSIAGQPRRSKKLALNVGMSGLVIDHGICKTTLGSLALTVNSPQTPPFNLVAGVLFIGSKLNRIFIKCTVTHRDGVRLQSKRSFRGACFLLRS